MKEMNAFALISGGIGLILLGFYCTVTILGK